MKEEIVQLQKLMERDGIDVYYVPSSDYHMSEYVGSFFQGRKFLSGFTGSAGTLVVSRDNAYLFTDGRYFIQASNELEGSGIKLMKMGEPNVKTEQELIDELLDNKKTLAIDGRTVNANLGLTFEKIVKKHQGNIIYDVDLVGEIWLNRPNMSKEKAFYLDEKYQGRTINEKLTLIRHEMEKEKCTLHVLSSLDDIAWSLNLRGHDVLYNPVVLAYLIIYMDKAILFVDKEKLNKKIKDKLKEANVVVRDYNSFYQFISKISIKEKVLIDYNKANYLLLKVFKKRVELINRTNPEIIFKAIKNEIEINNTKNAHIKDGVAVTKFMYWLKKNIGKIEITELSAANYLLDLRKEQKGFIEPSFSTICAYKENAAIMHYTATKERFTELKPHGYLLVDSGGQYFEGTTDITRTIALGDLTDEEKLHYTAVLKGMIDLSITKFLYGVRGTALDGIVRRNIWNLLIDYKCGTGHGIGYLLNVHESPNGFRWKIVPERNDSAILEEGMITTNEPGIYIEGSHGIRIENEILTKKITENEFGTFMEFETITLAPIDLDGVIVENLTNEEKEFLNNYHQEVYSKLSPFLNKEEKEWLKHVTRSI